MSDSSQFWSAVIRDHYVDLSSVQEAAATRELDDRYEPLRELGSGGMAHVILCRDRRLRRAVALKLPRADRVGGGDWLGREAAMCAAVDHPGVVPIYECSAPDAAVPYFTMRALSDTTMADRIAAGAETSELLDIILRACEAVAVAHGSGVAHMDLKPANIVTGRFEVVVVDWGFARRKDDGAAVRGGTPAYMAPERFGTDPDVDGPRSDVFALGAMLAEALIGRRPYGAATTDPARGIELDATRARLAAQAVDRAMAELARACLAPDPAVRPGDAAVVLARIQAHRRAIEQQSRAAELRAATARSRRIAWMAGGAAVLAVVLVVGWLSIGQDLLRSWRLGKGMALLRDARRVEGAGDHRRAESMYREIVELLPRSGEAWNNLGALLAQQGDHAGALPCFQQSCRLMPRYGAGHMNLGLLHRHLGAPTDAIPPLRHALALRPWHGQTADLLANSLETTGQAGEAADVAWLAGIANPMDVGNWVRHAACRVAAADAAQGAAAAFAGLVHFPRNAKLRELWGAAAPAERRAELDTRLAQLLDPDASRAAASPLEQAVLATRFGELEPAAALWHALLDDDSLPWWLRIEATVAQWRPVSGDGEAGPAQRASAATQATIRWLDRCEREGRGRLAWMGATALIQHPDLSCQFDGVVATHPSLQNVVPELRDSLHALAHRTRFTMVMYE